MMSGSVVAGILLALVSQQPTRDVDDTHRQEVLRERWLERLEAECSRVDGDKQEFATSYFAMALADAGDVEGAIAVIEQELPPRRSADMMLSVAGKLSAQDRLKEALAIVKTLPEQDRAGGYEIVAIRQVERGNLDAARSLLPQIKRQFELDRALASVAKAEAASGQILRARKTAGAIYDGYVRQRILTEVTRWEKKEPFPIRELQSPFLREHFEFLLRLNGREGIDEAILALAAAQNKDEEQLAIHVTTSLENLKKSRPLEAATARTMIAVAFIEAEQRNKAKEMILKVRQNAEDGWLGVSEIFDSSVLVYLLIYLEMNGELKMLMNALDPANSADPDAYHAGLQVMGKTFAELRRMDDMEAYYERMDSPTNRIRFASGVLGGIHVRP